MLGQSVPIHHHRSPEREHSHTKKQYSYEEMKRWCEDLLQTKTTLLLQQINQNNQVIKILSEKLKSLEQQLSRKEQSIPKHRQISNSLSNDEIIHIMNNLLNSKLRDVQEEVTFKLNALQQSKQHMLKHQTKKELQLYQQRMEDEINSKISNIKSMVKDRLEHTQTHNTEYWGKIKAWLKRLEEKFNKCLDQGNLVQKGLEQIEESVSRSLLNVYKMRNFNTRVKEIEVSVYELEESFKNITEYQGEYRMLVENRQRESLESLPDIKFRRKEIDSVIQMDREPVVLPKFQKLSPLQNNFLQKGDSHLVLHSSFYSSTTARKPHTGLNDLKKRILQLLSQKGLPLPLNCFRDQFGYLKNSLNNYIFDLQGNMFKVSLDQMQQLSSPPLNVLNVI